MSLTVEFYRSNSHPCPHDDSGKPVCTVQEFYDSGDPHCGLTCRPDNPISPIRRGSGNNIYVSPAPTVLDFQTAMILSAACCIPGLLLLVSLWLKIIEESWKKKWRQQTAEDDKVIGDEKKGANEFVKFIRKFFEVPVFAGATTVILIFGERNFFSKPVLKHTEPVGNIGELFYSPIQSKF